MNEKHEDLSSTFEDLFTFLNESEYHWRPQIPEQLVHLRRHKDAFRSIEQYFGLGIPLDYFHLQKDGLPESLYQKLYPLKIAVSQSHSYFIPHSHWPSHPENAHRYVHYGQETLTLIQHIRNRFPSLHNRKVLDLGSSSGALALEFALEAEEVLGIDCCTQAIHWATASAKAQKTPRLRFIEASIGTPKAEAAVGHQSWDLVVANPPFTIPRIDAFSPHRDGGKFGIELPLLFMDFASRHLKTKGDYVCLISNPVVHGKSLFFEQINYRQWKVLEKKCLNTHFNHQLYRKENYLEQGINRVELYFLHLQKI